jgi:hypothetical protein
MSVALQSCDGTGAPPSMTDMDGAGNNFVYSRVRLAFSGNYPTGGDTVDLTPLAAVVPSGALPINVISEGNGPATVPSLSAAGGYYQIVAAAVPALNNFKIKIFKNTAGSVTEYPAGAYGTDVTTDTVDLEVTWRKLRNY